MHFVNGMCALWMLCNLKFNLPDHILTTFYIWNRCYVFIASTKGIQCIPYTLWKQRCIDFPSYFVSFSEFSQHFFPLFPFLSFSFPFFPILSHSFPFFLTFQMQCSVFLCQIFLMIQRIKCFQANNVQGNFTLIQQTNDNSHSS